MERPDAAGVLICGRFGSGKSTVVEQLAHVLERAGAPFAALDLDWLWWFGVPSLRRDRALQVLFENLRTVADQYLRAGVTRFAMAWAARDADDVAGVRAAVPFPIRSVELVAPSEVIEARLRSSVTAGRLDDLAESDRWAASGLGSGFADVRVGSDRPVSETAGEILTWLDWA